MWVKGQIVHDFDDATGGVKDLLARNTQHHLFDRISWFELLWAHNSLGARPIIARSWASGARAWLFLAQTSATRANSLANYYTLSFRPIFSGDPAPETRKALLTAIARRLRMAPLKLAHIALSPVPEQDGSADLLATAFRSAGWLVFRSPAAANWTIDVRNKSFDTYWAERPGALRSTYARKLKKSNIITEIHHTLSAKIWADYEEIYAESWKPEEGSTAFLRALAEQEAAANCLRLGIARLDGVAIAAQLWTIDSDRAIIHKLAYRESSAALSPGTILTAAMFRHVINEDRVPLIDYGTGNDRYKADWMDTRNMLERIECYNPIHAHALVLAAQKYLTRLARSFRDA